MNDRKLALKLRQGDRTALNRAVDSYTPYLSAVVWRALGPNASAEDVEEIVSDAFLTLWTHRDTLQTEQSVKPWLAAVARNKAIDRLRAAPPPSLPLDAAEGLCRPGLENGLEQRLFAGALWQAVDSLPHPDNQLVFRFYYEEEKLKDIAKDLNLSVSAAKSRLRRARLKLKQILTEGGLAYGSDI